ncbi:hypothetical protein ACQ86N_45910 [Puia sp. P3]|uniref:hypothetical protein n=1 Tax=Puia sp. P3 TaxID=3423952 RepID=UPI003D66C504
MYDVHAEDQGYFEPAFLYGNTLYFFDLCDGFYIEKPSNLSFFYLLCDVGVAGLARSDVSGSGRFSCPIFSSRVILLISVVMNPFIFSADVCAVAIPVDRRSIAKV